MNDLNRPRACASIELLVVERLNLGRVQILQPDFAEARGRLALLFIQNGRPADAIPRFDAYVHVFGEKQTLRVQYACPVGWSLDVEDEMVKGALAVFEFMKISPLYKWVYETASTDSFVSIEKAERVLGYRPRWSNQDALVRNYRWYFDNLSHFQGASGISHRVPWSQGILSLVKLFF